MPDKFYYTKKEAVFDFLSHNLKIQTKDLYKKFPYIEKTTLRVYKREFKIFNKDGLLEYIPDIKNIMYLLAYKYIQEKEISIEETKSIERLGLLIKRYE